MTIKLDASQLKYLSVSLPMTVAASILLFVTPPHDPRLTAGQTVSGMKYCVAHGLEPVIERDANMDAVDIKCVLSEPFYEKYSIARSDLK